MSEFVGYVLLSVGIAFDVFACIGLVRLPDVYNRLQAATKCATMGTSLIMLSVFFFTGFGPVTIKADRSAFENSRRDRIVKQAGDVMDRLWKAAGLTSEGKLAAAAGP